MQGKSTETTPRILIFTTAFRPLVGGSEIALEEISRRLTEFHFDIVTGRPDGTAKTETTANSTIYRTGRIDQDATISKVLLPIRLWWQGARLTYRHDYRAIHAYQASQAAGAAWLLKLWHPEIPLIVTLQEGKDFRSQSRFVNFFRNLILRQADVITVISGYLEERARAINPRASIVRIPNGVDPEVFRRRDVSALRSSLHLSDTDRVVISVSRFVPKNGLADLVAAFRLVHERHPEAKLILAGLGILESELKQQARGLPVQFVKSVPYAELPQYLSLADVFVRPSLSEGLGTAFLEAMACGVPVIGSKVGGIPDIITPETGLLVQPGDVGGIAQAIERILTDRDFHDSCAEAGRRRVETQFTWETAAEKFKSVYGNL